jgi:hypothetical protein
MTGSADRPCTEARMIAACAGLRALALGIALPRIRDGLARGRRCLRTHGRFWSWWSPCLDAAAFHASLDKVEMLCAVAPATSATHTPHTGQPWGLLRAGRIDPAWVVARLTGRWRDLMLRRRLGDRNARRVSS